MRPSPQRQWGRVLVLERAAVAGGTTAMANSTLLSAAAPPRSEATGHPDGSAEETYKYLVAMSREPGARQIRAYCDGSVEHFNWLEDLGVHFRTQLLSRTKR